MKFILITFNTYDVKHYANISSQNSNHLRSISILLRRDYNVISMITEIIAIIHVNSENGWKLDLSAGRG